MGTTRAARRIGRPISLPRPSRRGVAVLALVGANAVWGVSIAATEPVLANVPPATLAFLRAAVALAVLWPLAARAGVGLARGRAPALMGLTGVALFGLCQNVGLHYASAATASLIQGAIPVLTVLLAAAVLGERLGRRRLAGIVASLGGVGALVLGGEAELGVAALGNLLPLASAISFAAFTVLGRRVFAAGVVAALAGGTRYAVIGLLPVAALELAVIGMGTLTARDVLLVLFLGAGCSALAFALAACGLRHLEAGQAAVFGNLKPLGGIGLAAVLLDARLTPIHLGAGAVVLGGVWLATRPHYAERAGRGSVERDGARTSAARRWPTSRILPPLARMNPIAYGALRRSTTNR